MSRNCAVHAVVEARPATVLAELGRVQGAYVVPNAGRRWSSARRSSSSDIECRIRHRNSIKFAASRKRHDQRRDCCC